MGRGQELLDAARKGDIRVVEKIIGQITKRSGPFTSLRRGAGVNVQDDNGYTPLHHACLHGHKEIVRLLLSVDASPCIVDKKGATALHLAAWKGDIDVVRMLLGHNNPAVNIDHLTSDQETAVLIAARSGYVAVVEILLANGADVSINNIKDEGALDLAAHYGRLETVQLLLRLRPQLVDPYKYPISRGRTFSSTPLHRAAKNGHKEVVTVLINAGIDPNVRTQSGTPLHEAACFGKASVVRILLSKGADLNAADRRGKTVHDLLADYSEEATRRVRKAIREYEALVRNTYESEEDLPPFPVQDYSPTGYAHPVGMKAPETQKTSNKKESLLFPSSSSSSITKNNPQSFVRKLANKCLGLKNKFNSAPNISNNAGLESATDKTKYNVPKSPLLTGNSKFFRVLSKKEESGVVDCNDEFDTISLDRLATLNRDSSVNRSNRSCPGFKTSLPNISENNELSDSDSVSSESDLTPNQLSDYQPELIQAINNNLKIGSKDPKDRTSVISGESTNLVNECYESYEFENNNEVKKTAPKPPPRPNVIVTENIIKSTIYENVVLENTVVRPKPAMRIHVPVQSDETKKGFYENISVLKGKPEPPKRTALSVKETTLPVKETIVPIKEIVTDLDEDPSPSISRSSTLSSDSMLDETNLEDILLSEKSKSFRHSKSSSIYPSLPKSNVNRTESNASDLSNVTQASAIENVDCSGDNEKSVYLSMTGTLPNKKPKGTVKKKVLFRHKTFTNIEADRNSTKVKDLPRWDGEFLKETLAHYHIRGTGHCIYKAPTVQEFIYIFNRDTLYKDVEPFTKVPNNKRGSYYETAICFCRPRPPKHHSSAEDLLERVPQDNEGTVSIDLESLKEQHEIISSTFQCFCDSEQCKLHEKRRESSSNFIVKFSMIKKSISTPDITLDSSPYPTVQNRLPKIKSVPILEEHYASVSIEDIVLRCSETEKSKGQSEPQNGSNSPVYTTMSYPSTLSSSNGRPYSVKDISEAISLSSADASLTASGVPKKSITSEHSDHWSLQSCTSNVTIKSDASFKSCFEESDEDSDSYTDSDTDTLKSDVSTSKRPWVHSDSFRFGSKESKDVETIVEESKESDSKLKSDSIRFRSNESNVKTIVEDSKKSDSKFESDSLRFGSKESNVETIVEESKESDSKFKSGISVGSSGSSFDETEGVPRSDELGASLVCEGVNPGGDSSGGRRRWDDVEVASEGDALSVSSAASSCAPLHLAHHHDYSKVSPTPPKKPPRRNLSVSPTHANSPSSGYSYELRPHARSQDDLDDLQGAKHYLKHGRSVDQYVDGKPFIEYEEPRIPPVPNPRPSLKNRSQPVAITAMYENVVIKEQNPRRKYRRNNLAYENVEPRMDRARKYSNQERSSLESLLDTDSPDYENRVQIPLSPTHYEQPPTPDHPPPSAKQAENSIHERIRPLSQEYKRRSALRDSQTETELMLLRATSVASVASGATDKSTDCVEEYVCDVPFAGLFKGSTTTLDGIGLRPVPAERPKTLRKLKAVYDASPTDPPTINFTNISSNGQDRNLNGEDEVRRRSNTSSSTHSGDKSLSILSPFDEQEEWAKISEIMASFGSKLVRESVFVSELEQEFTSRLGLSCSESSLSPSVASNLGHWLAGIGLHDFEPLLIENGYDDIDFINGILDENDLRDMGIEENDRHKILEAAKQLPLKIAEISVNHNNNNISSKKHQNDSVEEWLKQINLEQYSDTFRKHLYVDMDRVKRIWEVELTAVLEIKKLGHRKRILASVSGQQNGPVNHMDDINMDLNTLKHQLKVELKDKLPSENLKPVAPPVVPNLAPPGGETLKRSKKNRPAPQPPKPSDLEIRAPSELLVGMPGALKTQWKHQPFVLVTGAVTYVANYLGSTVVKELRGTESTKKSIQKLKKTTKEPRDSPDIILSISYRGVKFLNTITRDLICEHEIRNIHCACQDADDLTHFAYITKDHATKSHYCHVFRVATMDQATEVILTLGEAFEVAYQMALREQSNRARVTQSLAKTPTHDNKDKLNLNHGRSHSITEIKLNGHQLKIAPIPSSLSNEDFQSRNDGSRSPRTALLKAPIASTEEL